MTSVAAAAAAVVASFLNCSPAIYWHKNYCYFWPGRNAVDLFDNASGEAMTLLFTFALETGGDLFKLSALNTTTDQPTDQINELLECWLAKASEFAIDIEFSVVRKYKNKTAYSLPGCVRRRRDTR